MTVLMLVGIIQEENEEQNPPLVVGLRFFNGGEGTIALRRAKRNAKKRYPNIDQSKIEWTVYEVTTSNWGWPKYLGNISYYS